MQVKGQAISPPHNYPALKQESGIDCPGSVRGDWAGRSPALPGRASPPELHTRRIYEMCAKGPAFSCSRGICRGSLVPRARGGGACAAGCSAGRQWAPPTAAALGGAEAERVTPPLAIRHPPEPQTCVTVPAVWSRGGGSHRSS